MARINELEKQLFVASKEAIILREEASIVDTSINADEINALKEELESSRLVRADLEEQVSTLERELEEATETGIELNKLLSETLEASKGKAHAGLAASVERLQQQLDNQRDKVDSLTSSLKATSAEVTLVDALESCLCIVYPFHSLFLNIASYICCRMKISNLWLLKERKKYQLSRQNLLQLQR